MSRYHRRQEGLQRYREKERRRKWLEAQPANVQAIHQRCDFIFATSLAMGLFGLLLWVSPALRSHLLSFWPGIASCGVLIGGLLWLYKRWEP